MSYHVHGRGIVCGLCNREVKPSGSRYTTGVELGGRTMTEEQYHEVLNYDPDDDSGAFYNAAGFEDRVMETYKKNQEIEAAGNLPPIAFDPNSQNVLAAEVASKE